MLTGIHFLLTYSCTYECDHCFLYSSPRAEGTFTIEQIRSVLDEMDKIGTIEWVYFEGGEPFLYYPVMVEGVRLAKEKGCKAGIVSNSYWAHSEADCELWLKALAKLKLDNLSLSFDEFHGREESEEAAKWTLEAAKKLGLSAGSICIEGPSVKPAEGIGKGEPVVGGGVMFKGRAVEKLTEGLPTRPIESFKTCPHEELVSPSRVHIDSFGNVHVCQGISMGNMWKKPLSELIEQYDHHKHPITGPLVEGGPARLAETYSIKPEGEFVEECHYCYEVRKRLIDRFPEYLCPGLVYGLE